MIALIGRALFTLLCIMTAPRETVPPPPTVQPRPAPPPDADNCAICHEQPRRGGTDYCGDACQGIWVANRNRAIPLPNTPPTLPDGGTYRRTT